MGIARTAPILVLIALSGCSEKLEASDPPAAAVAAEPDTEGHSAAPAEPAADDKSAAPPPGEPADEPRMQNPVQFD